MKPRVTFGFVNCNRLFYLKSCVESLLYTTRDYKNREFIIIDNASVEDGTDKYLDEKSKQGFKVIKQSKRDPANEFAKALNIIAREATGNFIVPLQGDMQFILDCNWLDRYVDFYQKNIENIGCILLDAQREITNLNHRPYGVIQSQQKHNFLLDVKRNPVCGAADVMYSRQIIEKIYPWDEKNDKHEGGGDSETKMLQKVRQIMTNTSARWFCAVPIVAPAVTIYTDIRGTNARVRGNRRYGDYWPSKKDFRYYQIHDDDSVSQLIEQFNGLPLSIEKLAAPVGFAAPVDDDGAWLKNPIRPETASSSDYVILDEKDNITIDEKKYVEQWLDS